MINRLVLTCATLVWACASGYAAEKKGSDYPEYSVVVLDFGIVLIARRIADLVGVRPGERHIAHAEAIKISQNPDVALYRMAAFDAHQRSEFPVRSGVRPNNVFRAVSHHHPVRVTRYLLIDRIN